MKKLLAVLLGVTLFFSVYQGSVHANETDLTSTVENLIGTPYKYGGTTVKGFDCSGFVSYVFKQYKITLPRTSKSQAAMGDKVAKINLQSGDLVFFNTSGKGISHVGIYLGEGKFVHSSSSKGVTVSKLSDSYYAKRYVTARRIAANKSFI